MTPLQRKFAWAGLIGILLALALAASWRQTMPDPAQVSGSMSSMTPPAGARQPAGAPVTATGANPLSEAPPPQPVAMPVAATAATVPDQRPGISFRPDTESFYPAESRRLGEEGTSRLRLCFDDLGRVTEVTLAASSGSERLDAAAVQMGWHYRFTTTVVDGAPVQRQCFIQPVRFTQRVP